jgi:hypothetical protein
MMRLGVGMHSLPGGRAYAWANRISWCAGIFAAFTFFSLIPHWYFGLPVALIGVWVTTALSGLIWYQFRELLSCTEPFHRVQAGIILVLAFPIGCIALYLIPNWKDFEFNGHPSLVAVAGSVLLGIVSFIYAAGLVTLLCTVASYLTRRIFGMGRTS